MGTTSGGSRESKTPKSLNRNVQHQDGTNLDIVRSLHLNVLNSGVSQSVHANETVDALKQLTELLISGDANNNETIFEYFCEENLMEYMTSVLCKSPSTTVRIQLVQTISMLIHNVQNKRILYYLLSNNYINGMISAPEMYSGDDVSSWTVSLLKTLSGLLNTNTIKFFFREKNDSFPLLEQALRFLSSSDSMKSAHVMTIILNILRVNDPCVNRHILEKSNILTLMPLYLKQCWRRLNKRVKATNLSTVGHSEDSILTRCDDVYCFLQDLMELEIPEINHVLSVRLLNICFFPLMSTLLKGRNMGAQFLDEFTVPQVLNSEGFSEIYQGLCMGNGLVDIYARNKSEICLGGATTPVSPNVSPNVSPKASPNDTGEFDEVSTPVSSNVTTQEFDEKVSTPVSSNLSMKEFDEKVSTPVYKEIDSLEEYGQYSNSFSGLPSVTLLDISSPTSSSRSSPSSRISNAHFGNISPVISCGKFSENVAYYLLTSCLGSARRVELRHALLLLLFCPFAPKSVLERIQSFAPGGQYPMEKLERKGSVDSGSGVHLRDKSDVVFSSMSSWCCLVFDGDPLLQTSAFKNFRVADDMESLEEFESSNFSEKFVHNILMGEFVRMAVVSLPTSDNRLSMLLSLLIRLHRNFGYPNQKDFGLNYYQFRNFVLAPCCDHGLHIFLQLWNSICSNLTNICLRAHVLQLAVILTFLYILYFRRFDPKGLKSFSEELRFHLEAGFGLLRMLLFNHLETATLPDLAGFFEEWIYFNSINYDLDILQFPQVIYDASIPMSEGDGKDKDVEVITKKNINAGDYRNYFGNQLFREGQGPKKTLPGVPKGVELVSVGGSSRRLINTDANSAWKAAGTPVDIYRRHIRVMLLLQDALRQINDVDSIDIGRYSGTRHTIAARESFYDSCPLFYGHFGFLKTEDGTDVSLGAELSLENMKVIPCKMLIGGQKKRRALIRHTVFFLLARPKLSAAEEFDDSTKADTACDSPRGTGEITCVHPFWNIKINAIDDGFHRCTVSVAWYPEEKQTLRSARPFCETPTPTITDFELSFGSSDHLKEFVAFHRLATGSLCTICSGSLREYFFRS